MTLFQEKIYPVRKARRNHNKKRKSKFSNGVYQIVRKIPKGKIITYKEVVKKAGQPRAFRAVGNILNKNRDPKVPCHRVVRSNGKVGGYRKGIKNKIKILKKEGIIINSHGRIRIAEARRAKARYSHGKITP